MHGRLNRKPIRIGEKLKRLNAGLAIPLTMLVLSSLIAPLYAANPPAKKKAPTRLKIQAPCRAWVPKQTQPKLILLCVHGLGLNSDSYQLFGQQMQQQGIGCFAVDVRGFGTWMKLKGKDTLDFPACLDDVVQALKVLHQAYPGKAVFLLGESMGGAIAMRVAAEHQDLISGLISCVPSGSRFHNGKNVAQVALHLATLRGNKPIDVGSKVIEQASDSQAESTKWKDDPFDRLELSSKELIQFQRFMNRNHDAARQVDKIPVLFLVGLKDELVKPKGTVDLYNEVVSDDKQLITVKNSQHLIFELHKLSPELNGALVSWLITRSSHATSSPSKPASATK